MMRKREARGPGGRPQGLRKLIVTLQRKAERERSDHAALPVGHFSNADKGAVSSAMSERAGTWDMGRC
jgi:hypothetical protein